MAETGFINRAIIEAGVAKENVIGSIAPGKLANFTILADTPLTVDGAKIKDIPVWATVHEGRILPVKHVGKARTSIGPMQDASTVTLMESDAHHERADHKDICTFNQLLATAFIPASKDDLKSGRSTRKTRRA